MSARGREHELIDDRIRYIRCQYKHIYYSGKRFAKLLQLSVEEFVPDCQFEFFRREPFDPSFCMALMTM